MKIIFLDTETTDLEKDANLVQLAYKNTVTGKVVNEYFKPTKPISYGAMAVHHITNEMVENKPIFAGSPQQLELVEELDDAIVVAHNVMYDINVLKNEGVVVNQYLDTLRLARHLVDSEEYKLQYLRYFLKLTGNGSAHDALGDIIVLESLFNHLKNLIAQNFKLQDDGEIMEKMLELNKLPVLLKNINFGKYKGKTFKEVGEIDPDYLAWLYGSESQKPIAEQDEEKIYTLKHYLNV